MPKNLLGKDSPIRHHLDRRAASLTECSEDLDGLLTTRETAEWLGVSTQFLEIGRSRGYGPHFTRLSPRHIRYRRRDVISWLERRTHVSTANYIYVGGKS
jgi:hypothetical protein